MHAEEVADMPAGENGPTMLQQQQQQGSMGSNTSLQRGESRSTLMHAAAVNGDKSALNKLLNRKK